MSDKTLAELMREEKCCGACEWFKSTEWFGFVFNGECEIDGEKRCSLRGCCDMYREKAQR